MDLERFAELVNSGRYLAALQVLASSEEIRQGLVDAGVDLAELTTSLAEAAIASTKSLEPALSLARRVSQDAWKKLLGELGDIAIYLVSELRRDPGKLALLAGQLSEYRGQAPEAWAYAVLPSSGPGSRLLEALDRGDYAGALEALATLPRSALEAVSTLAGDPAALAEALAYNAVLNGMDPSRALALASRAGVDARGAVAAALADLASEAAREGSPGELERVISSASRVGLADVAAYSAIETAASSILKAEESGDYRAALKALAGDSRAREVLSVALPALGYSLPELVVYLAASAVESGADPGEVVSLAAQALPESRDTVAEAVLAVLASRLSEAIGSGQFDALTQLAGALASLSKASAAVSEEAARLAAVAKAYGNPRVRAVIQALESGDYRAAYSALSKFTEQDAKTLDAYLAAVGAGLTAADLASAVKAAAAAEALKSLGEDPEPLRVYDALSEIYSHSELEAMGISRGAVDLAEVAWLLRHGRLADAVKYAGSRGGDLPAALLSLALQDPGRLGVEGLRLLERLAERYGLDDAASLIRQYLALSSDDFRQALREAMENAVKAASEAAAGDAVESLVEAMKKGDVERVKGLLARYSSLYEEVKVNGYALADVAKAYIEYAERFAPRAKRVFDALKSPPKDPAQLEALADEAANLAADLKSLAPLTALMDKDALNAVYEGLKRVRAALLAQAAAARLLSGDTAGAARDAVVAASLDEAYSWLPGLVESVKTGDIASEAFCILEALGISVPKPSGQGGWSQPTAM